jgi:hypothetical protein
MKRDLAFKQTLLRTCGKAGAAALLCFGFATAGPAARAATPESPVGVWDCVMSGAGQQGIAFLTFSDDGTFSGYELQATAPKVDNTVVSPGRNDDGDTGRLPGQTTINTNVSAITMYVFGFGGIGGPWAFDNKGRIIGNFYQVLNPAAATTNWFQTCINSDVTLTTYLGTNQFTSQAALGFCFTNESYVTNASFTLPLNLSNTIPPQITTTGTNWLPTCVNTNVLFIANVIGQVGTNQFILRGPISTCFSGPSFATNAGFSIPISFTNGNLTTNVITQDWPPMTVHTNLLFRNTNADGIQWTLYAALDLTFSGPEFTTNYELGAILTNWFTLTNLGYPDQPIACISTNVNLVTNLVDQYGETLAFTATASADYCFAGQSLYTNVVFDFTADFPITFLNTNAPLTVVTTNYGLTCPNTAIEFIAVLGEDTDNPSTNILETNVVYCFSDPFLTTNLLCPPLFLFTNTQQAVVQTTNWNQACVSTNLVVSATVSGQTTWTSTNVLVCFNTAQIQTNITLFSPNLTFSNTDFTITPGPGTATNAISFVGTVTPGKRLALVATTSYGKVTYNGTPLNTSPYDLSGPWYGYLKDGEEMLEFFTLTPVTEANNPWGDVAPDLPTYPNIYLVTQGIGPDYSFNGISMLSSQKKIGFAFETTALGSSNTVLSATYGTLSASRKATNVVTKGIDASFNAMSFNATEQ